MSNMELFMQYVTYVLMVVGGLAFVVSAIVQAIKELPGLQRVPTNAVALAVSVVLCLLAVIMVCQYLNIMIVWYYPVAGLIAAFIVYLVATGGWERVSAMWSRTKYKNK